MVGVGVGGIYVFLDMEADNRTSTRPRQRDGWMPWANPGVHELAVGLRTGAVARAVGESGHDDKLFPLETRLARSSVRRVPSQKGTWLHHWQWRSMRFAA